MGEDDSMNCVCVQKYGKCLCKDCKCKKIEVDSMNCVCIQKYGKCLCKDCKCKKIENISLDQTENELLSLTKSLANHNQMIADLMKSRDLIEEQIKSLMTKKLVVQTEVAPKKGGCCKGKKD